VRVCRFEGEKRHQGKRWGLERRDAGRGQPASQGWGAFALRWIRADTGGTKEESAILCGRTAIRTWSTVCAVCRLREMHCS